MAQHSALFRELRSLTAEGRTEERKACLWGHWLEIRDFLLQHHPDGLSTEDLHRFVDDALPRYFHTIELLPAEDGLSVLEVGANPYLFSILLDQLFSYRLSYVNFFGSDIYDESVSHLTQSVHNAVTGATRPFSSVLCNIEAVDLPFRDGAFDLVLFCEVLEHIVIDPLAVLPRLRRVLAPGGRLVVTTPNAVRLSNVALMLAGHNFFDRYHPANGPYGRHNREFTLQEVDQLLTQAGFSVETALTLDRYDWDKIQLETDSYEPHQKVRFKRSETIERLRRIGASTTDRGDNLYVVARKPRSG